MGEVVQLKQFKRKLHRQKATNRYDLRDYIYALDAEEDAVMIEDLLHIMAVYFAEKPEPPRAS